MVPCTISCENGSRHIPRLSTQPERMKPERMKPERMKPERRPRGNANGPGWEDFSGRSGFAEVVGDIVPILEPEGLNSQSVEEPRCERDPARFRVLRKELRATGPRGELKKFKAFAWNDLEDSVDLHVIGTCCGCTEEWGCKGFPRSDIGRNSQFHGIRGYDFHYSSAHPGFAENRLDTKSILALQLRQISVAQGTG